MFSNTAAIDDGSCTTKLFFGANSLMSNCCGMKRQKAFINSLLDIISDCGAPTKLISNPTHIKLLNKAKDIL